MACFNTPQADKLHVGFKLVPRTAFERKFMLPSSRTIRPSGHGRALALSIPAMSLRLLLDVLSAIFMFVSATKDRAFSLPTAYCKSRP